MMVNMKELEGVVERINFDLFEKLQGDDLVDLVKVTASTCGHAQWVEFLDMTLWDSEEDLRPYDEEEDEYQDMDLHLREQVNMVLGKLGDIRIPASADGEKEEWVEPDQCLAAHVIEDEVCVMPLRCEFNAGHDGPHRTTYPGLDGDVAVPITWTTEEEGKKVAKFHRGKRAD